MSVNMISVRAMIPPAPTPCSDRPIKRTVKLLARAPASDPAVKITIATRSKGFRPNMFEKLPYAGWNTVEQRRNDVPAQKASTAEPCSFSAMMGRATEIEVASRAAASVI